MHAVDMVRPNLKSRCAHLRVSSPPYRHTSHEFGFGFAIGRGVTSRILYPAPDSKEKAADDQTLVVQFIIARKYRVLLVSDSGPETESLLSRRPNDLRSDILIKGSPRQGPSGDTAFLNAVKPRAVIATAAEFPASERIAANLVDNLRARGIRLFAQNRCGAVSVRIFPGYWEVSAFVDKQQYCHSR